MQPARFRPPLSFSIEKLVQGLGTAFERDGDFLKATGLPLNLYFFRNAEHIRKIYSEPGAGETKCPWLLMRVKWVMGEGAYILEGGEAWKEKRARVQPAFAKARISEYSRELSGVLGDVHDRWDRLAREGSELDTCQSLQELIARFSFRFLFSASLSEAEAAEIAHLTHFLNVRFVKPSPIPGLGFRRSWRSLQSRFLVLTRSRRSESARADVISHLLQLRRPGSDEGWSDQEIVDEIASIYFGASVVSTTLSWTLYLLCVNPEIQDRLALELKETLGGRAPIEEDLPRLSFLENVLQETLRLYPPSWAYPRLCRKGMQIDDYTIPPGALLFPAVYHVQRDPRYWTDPERFDPDRFRNGVQAPAGAYLPFGRGPRTCLGSMLAPVIMKLTLASIFQRYRLSLMAEKSDPGIDFGFEMHPRGALRMKLIIR